MKRFAIVATVAFSLTACAALSLGDPWKPMKVPYNMSVIYLYSADSMPTGQEVHYDETPSTPDAKTKVGMVSGGYFPLLIPAGPIRLFSGDDQNGSCVEAVVQGGTEYFVRVGQQDETPTVTWVPPTEGTTDIASHKRIARELKQSSDGRFGANCVQPSF